MKHKKKHKSLNSHQVHVKLYNVILEDIAFALELRTHMQKTTPSKCLKPLEHIPPPVVSPYIKCSWDDLK